MKEIFGEVLSEGVAFANITFIKQINNYQEVLLNNDEIEQEIEKADSVFKKAIANINAELEGPYAKQNEEILAILKGHYILIEDGEISDQIKSFINDEKIDFTSACYKTIDFYKSIFSKMTDDYLKARIDDIRDIIERFINIFNEKTDDDYKGIIVAYDITPSVVAKFNQANVKGIITENGTKNCHSAIMARTVGIPYITNIKNINQLFCGNENVIINTFNESIIINPNSQQINEYKKIEQEYIQDTSHLNDFIGKPALLNDGEFIDLKVNISNENDVLIANNYGATSVGLLRSEYIYMNLEDFPTEEYLYTQYKKMTKDFEGEITIRTLDVGGDKSIDYFKIEKEQNPYLGYRAIRYCLEHQDMFKTQIKAILRVSAERNIQIMIPMITSLDEVKTVKMLIDVSKQELQLEGKAFDGNIKVGIMIETPASVLIADDLAKELDFFSIGSNDLLQYLMAADRNNASVKQSYNPYSQAFIKSLSQTVEAAKNNNISLSLCGEIGSDPDFLPILIGLGLRKISIAPSQVLKIKRLLSKLTIEKCEKLVRKIKTIKSEKEIKTIVEIGE